jgi:O-antigen/teichoic acid export membrane protein
MTARRLALGSALRTITLVATGAVSFLLMPFVVRSLGDRLFGLWSLVGTLVGYYGLLDLGLASAVNRHMASAFGSKDGQEANRVFNTALRLYLGIGTLVLAVTLVIATVAASAVPDPGDASLLGKVIVVLGTSLAFGFPVRVFVGALNADLRFDLTAGLDLLTLFLRAVLTVSVLLAGYKVLALAWVTLLSGLPAGVLAVYLARRTLPTLRVSRTFWSRPTARTLFSYSSYAFLAQVADMLRFRVDGFVLAAFLGLGSVTHFSIAGSLVQYFIQLLGAATGVFSSVFSRQDGARDVDAMRRTFLFASKVSVMVSTFVAFGLLAWGRQFIQRWMGTAYLDAYPVLTVLTLGATVALWQAPSVGLLFGVSRHKFFALANSVEGLANLALSILLVQRYGMLGVAYGTVIPMAAMKLLIQPVYVCHVSGVPYGSYVRRMARTAGASLLCLAVPAWVSLRFAAPEYGVLLATAGTCAVLYGAPLWFCAFTREEAKMLRGALLPLAFTRVAGA